MGAGSGSSGRRGSVDEPHSCHPCARLAGRSAGNTPRPQPPSHRSRWAGVPPASGTRRGRTVNRSVGALVVTLCVASMLEACASGSPTTAPATQASSPQLASVGLSSSTPAAEPSASPSPTLESPSSLPTASPSPSAVPEATYLPAPQPSPARPAAGAPATPTNAGIDYTSDPCDSANQDLPCSWLRVKWTEANPTGVTVRVYVLTACLHAPTQSKPTAQCVTDGDTLPGSSLLYMGNAPASTRSFSFQVLEGEGSALGKLPGGGPIVEAVVIQAVNPKGGSPFAIAASSGSCYGCVL